MEFDSGWRSCRRPSISLPKPKQELPQKLTKPRSMGVCPRTLTVVIPSHKPRTKSAIPRRTSAARASPCSSLPSTSRSITTRMHMTIKSWCVGRSRTNLLAPDDIRRNVSRLRALYFERSSQGSYFVDRSSTGNTGGVLDFRFDGHRLPLSSRPSILECEPPRRAAETIQLDSQLCARRPAKLSGRLESLLFYGANVDIGPIGQAWSGNAYYFNQMVNGVVDRRAVGTEVRYGSNGINVYALVDYDIYFNALNIAMLNGSWVDKRNNLQLHGGPSQDSILANGERALWNPRGFPE